jgi:hypothetical protein
MWQNIYLHLKNKGIDVYSIGQKQGLCNDPYVVVKESGQYPLSSNKQGYDLVDIIIFYPVGSYSQLFSYKNDIKNYLAELKYLRKTGNETPVIIDDEVKGYTTSVEYQVLKKF